jgi:hypothetical protein
MDGWLAGTGLGGGPGALIWWGRRQPEINVGRRDGILHGSPVAARGCGAWWSPPSVGWGVTELGSSAPECANQDSAQRLLFFRESERAFGRTCFGSDAAEPQSDFRDSQRPVVQNGR